MLYNGRLRTEARQAWPKNDLRPNGFYISSSPRFITGHHLWSRFPFPGKVMTKLSECPIRGQPFAIRHAIVDAPSSKLRSTSSQFRIRPIDRPIRR